MRRRAKRLLGGAEQVILDCGKGVRLLGFFNCRQQSTKGLVILLHGWEGSSDSCYLLSAATYLFERGFNVFRLNLRDHGASHHLNRGLFNSTRLDEVVNAVAEIHRRFPHYAKYIAGFSLGGNFALRIGIEAPAQSIHLDKIVAVSPLINPAKATRLLEERQLIYHQYFVRKWKRSLRRKLEYFPEHNYGDTLLRLNTLSDMNDYFVPRHTGYSISEDYLNAYGLDGGRLSGLQVDSHIITAKDDPITRIDDLDAIPLRPSCLEVEVTDRGGHCGFLEAIHKPSWVDRRLFSLLQTSTAEKKG